MKKIIIFLLILTSIATTVYSESSVVTCTFTGDIMIGTDYPFNALPPNDGKTYFDGVRRFFNEDILVGNLEGAITTVKNSPKARMKSKNVYAFRMPVRYAKYFKQASFDVLSVANNHALDFTVQGNIDTIRYIEAQGIKTTGLRNKLTIVERNGIKVGFLGYCWYNRFNSIFDFNAAKKLVSSSKKKVDVLVVYFHGGAEGTKAQRVPKGMERFYNTPRGNLRAFSRVVIDAGADAVVGHGPHVLRGAEWYKGKLIAYSLGNFGTYGRFSLSYPKNISGLLNLTFDKSGKIQGGSIIPTVLVGRGIPQYDSQKRAISIMNRLSRADFKNPVIFDKTGNLLVK